MLAVRVAIRVPRGSWIAGAPVMPSLEPVAVVRIEPCGRGMRGPGVGHGWPRAGPYVPMLDASVGGMDCRELVV